MTVFATCLIAAEHVVAAEHTVIVVQSSASGPDAGDSFAGLIGSIFTFLLYVCLAGCICSCFCCYYARYKAQQVAQQTTGPQTTTFFGRMTSAVVRPSLAHQNAGCPELTPVRHTKQGYKAQSQPAQTAYAVIQHVEGSLGSATGCGLPHARRGFPHSGGGRHAGSE